jgi:hypothetical protein
LEDKSSFPVELDRICEGTLIGNPAELGVFTEGGPIKEGVSTRLTMPGLFEMISTDQLLAIILDCIVSYHFELERA